MTDKKDIQKDIEQLQIVEQTLQTTMQQKQAFHAQLLEIDNALTEIGKAKEKVYKVVGPVMVLADKDQVKKDLESRKELLSVRADNLEKHESKLKDKFESLQKQVMESMKK
ncbi:MAG: prefoldin subunit beta [Nanoarchaeota archaeon]